MLSDKGLSGYRLLEKFTTEKPFYDGGIDFTILVQSPGMDPGVKSQPYRVSIILVIINAF